MTVKLVEINKNNAGQRVDNFLLKTLKGVPKSRIYRIIRKGEVRVNKKRVKPDRRLEENDIVRIPPVRVSDKTCVAKPSTSLINLLNSRMIYEDEYLLVLNKPHGIAVHAGTNVDVGVIEALRVMRPDDGFLELAHRIDRDTSGCLIVAKSRLALMELHDIFRDGKIEKIYLALTKGQWDPSEYKVSLNLQKNQIESGERIVKVANFGKRSVTQFKQIKQFDLCSLVEAKIQTGRTHQIRVHAQYRLHPVACDRKYGENEFNRSMKTFGLSRLFLHASSLSFYLPLAGKQINVSAPLDDDLQVVLDRLSSV